jgi:hypothetical protein
MAGERRSAYSSTGEKVAEGALAGVERAMTDAADRMVPRKATRLILKKIPGAPGFVYDVAQVASAKPEARVRKTFGAAGGLIGRPAGARSELRQAA